MMALEVSALSVGENMQICAGGETTLVSGGGCFIFFYFIIKILFVSIVPFSAPLGVA